jgi:hypothetical protein
MKNTKEKTDYSKLYRVEFPLHRKLYDWMNKSVPQREGPSGHSKWYTMSYDFQSSMGKSTYKVQVTVDHIYSNHVIKITCYSYTSGSSYPYYKPASRYCPETYVFVKDFGLFPDNGRHIEQIKQLVPVEYHQVFGRMS